MENWKSKEIQSTSRSTRVGILEEDRRLSHQRVLELLNTSRPFRSFYNGLLADSPYAAFFWENKPITRQNMDEYYEFRLLESPFLKDKQPDRRTFSQYFSADELVATFPNLGGDAKLIAPCPRNSAPGYAHIGTFVRKAPAEQIDQFWKVTALEMLATISDQPRWLSTSGLGVFWLHARIDTHPKYYQTEEYKQL